MKADAHAGKGDMMEEKMVWPNRLILWSPITQNPRLVMVFRERIYREASWRDDEGLARAQAILMHQDVSCGVAEAAFLKGIIVRLNGTEAGIRELSAATLSLHVDGENVLMEEIGLLAKTQEPVPVLDSPKVSCLFQSRVPKEGLTSYVEEPSVGYFLPNASLIMAKIDEFRSPKGLGGKISIDVVLGLYSPEPPTTDGMSRER